MDTHVTIEGNLTRDPELRFTQAGKAMATFGVAVNKRFLVQQTNTWQEQTSFFNVVVWGDQAGNVADTLTKGDRAVISGELVQRSYTVQGQGGQPDETRSVFEIKADVVGVALRFATAEVTKVTQARPAPAPEGEVVGAASGAAEAY